MSFYPPNLNLPESLKTAEFQLRPLTPAHLEIDYEAVIASREMLNLWSGSPWPRPGFTLAENLADLEWHDREHRERAAFTYTIVDPIGSICLGCLYIRPLSELTVAISPDQTTVLPDEAAARFWVRSSRLADGLDLRLLQRLIAWFEESWTFSKLYFHTREVNTQQSALFETAGLDHQFDLLIPRRGGTHQFWAKSTKTTNE